MKQIVLFLALAGLMIAWISPAHAETRGAQFTVSLTLVGADGIQPVVGEVPMPPQSRLLTQNNDTAYRINRMNLQDSTQFFMEALPANGFVLASQEQGQGWWQGRWQQVKGGCLQVVLESVVGGDMTRIQTAPVVCG